ncbi:Fc.00g105400.m01.CDS01 [Cosmosporella sp. VM-42]
MSELQSVTVYMLGPSPNPWKVALVLEELGVPYKCERVTMASVKEEPYISINPNGRVPAIIDPNKDVTIWESGAIIDYLVDTYDSYAALHYTSYPEKYLTRSWRDFQISGQGPYFGQKGWFEKFHSEKLPSAIERYSAEIKRIIGVLNSHLGKQGTDFLVGNRISYADLMFVPYARSLGIAFAPEINTSEWKHYNAWLDRMYARPAVLKVFAAWDAEMTQPEG